MRDAEAYFGFGLPCRLFGVAPRLARVHSAASGVGALLFPEMLARPAVLTNSAGVYAAPIAEHVVGGLLYLLRRCDAAVDLHGGCGTTALRRLGIRRARAW